MKRIITLFGKYLILYLFILQITACKKETISWNLKKLPEVSNVRVINNTLTSFEIEATCESDGFDDETERGFCIYSSNSTLNCEIQLMDEGRGKGMFNATINWSTQNVYLIKAFVKNKIGINYSDPITIFWPGNSSNLPVVSTLNASNILFTEAAIAGQILSAGGLPNINIGFYLSTNSNPVQSNSTVIYSSLNNGTFFSEIIDSLQNNTTYFVRSFAENLAGRSLGNIISFTTKKMYNVGDTGPAGGIIFFFKQDTLNGWNFLEAAPNDLSLSYPWHSTNFANTNMNGTGIGSGLENTSGLINIFGNNSQYAALSCQNFLFNNYNDWHLPSRDELLLMKLNLFSQSLGAFTQNANYWSSSEDSFFTQNAWVVNMNSNQSSNATTIHKSQNVRIRPIRRF